MTESESGAVPLGDAPMMAQMLKFTCAVFVSAIADGVRLSYVAENQVVHVVTGVFHGRELPFLFYFGTLNRPVAGVERIELSLCGFGDRRSTS